MRIMHPQQYVAASDLTAALAGVPAVHSTMTGWGVGPFNAVSLIANRETPLHRDPKTTLRSYDMMTSVGSFVSAPMHLEGLGVEIMNAPGTVITLPGKTVRHAVERCEGEHVCFAYYARAALFERYHIRLPSWPEQSFYQHWVGTHSPFRRCQGQYPVMV